MGNVRHFAINADDLPRARTFYERVFGWTFEPWGPPGFFMISTGDADGRPLGSLQGRRELVPGQRMNGFECTIAVTSDVDEVAAAVKANGGRILMEKATIPSVGDLIWFEDPEGNDVDWLSNTEPSAARPRPDVGTRLPLEPLRSEKARQ